MTQPVPEESNEALDVTAPPPGEHDSELPDERDTAAASEQQENAGSPLDQPSDDVGQ
ncbi:MAG: hypothetical protein ACXWDL_12650 [Nocardioides sp.]